MVKNITILPDGPDSNPANDSFTPARQALKTGQVRCLGAAHARGRSGMDRYQRSHGSSWLIEAVIAGYGFVQADGQQQRAQTGDVYVFGPQATGRYRPDDNEPWEKLFIEVEGDLINALADAYSLEQQIMYPQAHVSQQMRSLLQLLSHRGTHFQRDFPIGLHRLISSIALSQFDKKESMAEFIESQIKHDFQLQDMATHFKYSKNHLLRLFKQEHDCSPYEYLIRKRVEQAIWALTHTSMSVKLIAAELCFSDSKHLSSTLKKRTGKSPREWRER